MSGNHDIAKMALIIIGAFGVIDLLSDSKCRINLTGSNGQKIDLNSMDDRYDSEDNSI